MSSAEPSPLAEAVEALSRRLNAVQWHILQTVAIVAQQQAVSRAGVATHNGCSKASAALAHLSAFRVAPVPPPPTDRETGSVAAAPADALPSATVVDSASPAPARGPFFKLSAPGLAFYRRTRLTVPTQQAANGALSIYLEGWARRNARQMLFGLAVLHDASVAQVEAAISTLSARHVATEAAIRAMLRSASPGEEALSS